MALISLNLAADGFENVAAGLGGYSDKRAYGYYRPVIPLTYVELDAMFRSSWSAKRIVKLPADDMTGVWRRFVLGDADENPQLKALEDAEKQFNVQAKFNEGTWQGNLYGGAIGIIGTADAVTPQDLAKPLDAKKVKKGDLKYFHIVDRWRASPSGQLVDDPNSPWWNLPDSYTLVSSTGSSRDSGLPVHHTRAIRFNGEPLPWYEWLRNGRWDDSVLQHCMDAIRDYDATVSNIMTMLYEANVDVVKSDEVSRILSEKDGESKLIRRFLAGMSMKSSVRTLLLDKDDEYEKKSNSFQNLADVWERAAENLCAASEIVMARLFGQAPGGLQSTGDADLQNHYKMISGRRDQRLRPQLNYFDEIFVRSTLGSMPADYSWDFNPLWEMSDTDKATVEYQNAQRDQIYVMQGVITPGLAASELKQRRTYSSMSEDDVDMAQELSKANQEMDEARNDAEKDQLENPDPTPETASGEEDSSAPPPGKGKKKAGKSAGAI